MESMELFFLRKNKKKIRDIYIDYIYMNYYYYTILGFNYLKPLNFEELEKKKSVVREKITWMISLFDPFLTPLYMI